MMPLAQRLNGRLELWRGQSRYADGGGGGGGAAAASGGGRGRFHAAKSSSTIEEHEVRVRRVRPSRPRAFPLISALCAGAAPFFFQPLETTCSKNLGSTFAQFEPKSSVELTAVERKRAEHGLLLPLRLFPALLLRSVQHN